VSSGTLSVSGGAQEAVSLAEGIAGVFSAETVHATVIGQGNVAASEASAANINVATGGILIAAGSITADFAMSNSTATCSSNGPAASGQFQVSGLVIEGQSIAVTGQANQTVVVNGNTVIINEQVVSQAATTADITVNALHIMTNTGLNLIFGSSSAGITCGNPPQPPPPCNDFVTGGGWITGTPSGAKANFGVAGGIKNGAFWGHLNYIDHGNGMHVKQTAVTGYAVNSMYPNNCRDISYDVTIDGAAGTAWVQVCDNGEPGRNDFFQINLSNLYHAAGDLGGGNIQLHKCQ